MASNDRSVSLRALIERMHKAATDARRAIGGKGMDWFRDMSAIACEATLVTRNDENDRHFMPIGKVTGRNYEALAEHFSWCSPNNVLALLEYLGQLEIQLAIAQQQNSAGDGAKQDDKPE